MSCREEQTGSPGIDNDADGRRSDDQAVTVFVMDVRLRSDPDVALSARGVAESLSMQFRSPDGLARTTLLISPPGEESILLPAADARILERDDRDDDLHRKATAAAAAWRIERHRIEKRMRVLDWIMVFVEEVQSAGTVTTVYEAVRTYAHQFVGAHAAAVYTRDPHDDASLRPMTEVSGVILPRLPLGLLSRFNTLTVLTDVEVRDDGASPYPMLTPVLNAFDAAQLLCASVGTDALLILAERRHTRVLTGEDRDMLEWMVRQAERALAAMPAYED